jgi:hypothetical protein
MFGVSDNNRSQDQGRRREASDPKEGGGKDTTAGTRTGSEAAMWAMSVLGNAKSNCHQKTHRVEPGGTGRKFTHLTRGGLARERAAGVSRGHSSEEARGNPGGAKGRREEARRDRRTPSRVRAGRPPKPTGRDNHGRLLVGREREAGVESPVERPCGSRVPPRAVKGKR